MVTFSLVLLSRLIQNRVGFFIVPLCDKKKSLLLRIYLDKPFGNRLTFYFLIDQFEEYFTYWLESAKSRSYNFDVSEKERIKDTFREYL